MDQLSTILLSSIMAGSTKAKVCCPANMDFKPVKCYDPIKRKVHRNDGCPCGSREKYKKCCGKNN